MSAESRTTGGTGPTRREFLAGTLAAALAGAGSAAGAAPAQAPAQAPAPGAGAMPVGRIKDLEVSRLLLGGNLLTHYTHSRDLKYVYALAARYNTDEKIRETLSLAEQHGVNTLVVHTVPRVLNILRDHRKAGGKIQWIICPTQNPEDEPAYARVVQELADNGTDAIYVWGVMADSLVAAGKVAVIARAVEAARALGVPSGVGGHDLRVVEECEKQQVPADFYIKTFHHHRYPSAPRSDEIKGPHAENPGYWCQDPDAVLRTMKAVTKPWLAFKVMAAGAIPPADAFPWAFAGGADHVLAGMFDFEIEQDAALVREAVAKVKRDRPWRS